MNSNLVDRLKFRHQFMRSLRDFLDDQGFVEIETPFLLSANTPDPHIDPVIAYLNHPTQERQLRTSPELWLKKALALGFSNIYELSRVFRDDPPSPAHSPEFTMLEWYRTGAELNDLIKDCQAIFALARHKAQQHDLKPKEAQAFLRCSARDLIIEHAHIDLDQILGIMQEGDTLALPRLLSERGDHLPNNSTFVDAFFHIMLKYVEPMLPRDHPVVITRWPVQLAALAAPCADDPRYAARFEIYYQGLEIANAYQECNDSEILRKRFQQENAERKALDKPEFPIDNDFLHIVTTLPKTAGIALGIDRLLLATLGSSHIREIIFGLNEEKNQPKQQ